MSGLCKVEMSGFMDGRGPHGDGANRFEPTRTGPLEGVARDTAEASDANSRGPAAENKRPPGAEDAAPPSPTRRSFPGSRTARPTIEPQAAGSLGAQDCGAPAAALCRFRTTLAAEHLAQEGFSVSRETLRKWMSKAGLWSPRSQRVKAVHVWRERRASFGELVMQDSSPFRWLEERGPACQLIALIDDATSKFWAQFTEHDSTETNLRPLGGWRRRDGRPLAHYTDKNSIFRTTRRAGIGEQLQGEEARSQFGR